MPDFNKLKRKLVPESNAHDEEVDKNFLKKVEESEKKRAKKIFKKFSIDLNKQKIPVKLEEIKELKQEIGIKFHRSHP